MTRKGRQTKPVALAEREPYTETKEYRQVLCPVCGRGAGLKRLSYPYQRGEQDVTQNYWDWLRDLEEGRGLGDEQPFGIIQEVGLGKGHSFRLIGYFTPEEDKEGFYPLVKARLLTAVRRWLKNGWLTQEELDLIAKEVVE
jgi:hypothetical protein